MSTGDPDPIVEIDGKTYIRNDAGVLVPFEFQIDSTQVTYASRTIKSNWTPAAVESLKDLWGLGGPDYPDNALDRLNDALDDPDYDPTKSEEYKGIPRWPDGRKATKEEYLAHNPIAKMADEMAKEIDAEILKDLGL